MSINAHSTDGESAASDAERLVKFVRESGAELFCDQLGKPRIAIPNDRHHKIWPLRSPRVSAWLAKLFNDKTKAFVSRSDLAAAMLILEGGAWEVDSRPPACDPLWSVIEKQPVAQALIQIVNEEGNQACLTRDLYKKAKVLVKDEFSASWKFSTVVQVFSRKLNKLKPVFLAIGLRVDIRHREDGSHVTVEMLPTFKREPDANCVSASEVPSGVKDDGNLDSVDSDATDAISALTPDQEHLLSIYEGERDEC